MASPFVHARGKATHNVWHVFPVLAFFSENLLSLVYLFSRVTLVKCAEHPRLSSVSSGGYFELIRTRLQSVENALFVRIAAVLRFES